MWQNLFANFIYDDFIIKTMSNKFAIVDVNLTDLYIIVLIGD